MRNWLTTGIVLASLAIGGVFAVGRLSPAFAGENDHSRDGEIMFVDVDTNERIPSCRLHGAQIYRLVKSDHIQVFTPDGEKLCKYRVEDVTFTATQYSRPVGGSLFCWGPPVRATHVRMVVSVKTVD